MSHSSNVPLFPSSDDDGNPAGEQITLLDLFAGLAMAGMLANRRADVTDEEIAQDAYEQAKWMIDERAACSMLEE